MSNFMVNLWESVFTPGPTPTLIVATNASFACLQFVLFALLLATYSIHFVVLSALCAGLWWSINWFVAELEASKAQEEKAKNDRSGAALENEREELARREARSADSSETETEEATPAPEERKVPTTTSTTTSGRLRPGDVEDTRKRRSGAGMSESEGSVSTDSEWEKVDQ